MKCQSLFSGKSKKCRLMKISPSMLDVKGTTGNKRTVMFAKLFKDM